MSNAHTCIACVQVISCVTANQECINDIAASEVMAYLLMLLQMLPQCEHSCADDVQLSFSLC